MSLEACLEDLLLSKKFLEKRVIQKSITIVFAQGKTNLQEWTFTARR